MKLNLWNSIKICKLISVPISVYEKNEVFSSLSTANLYHLNEY